MPAHKRTWIHRDGIDNPGFPSGLPGGTVHGTARGCTGCHGGTDGTADRAAAHAGPGWTPRPGASACASCHPGEAALAAGSLHTTVAGLGAALAVRGMDLSAGSTGRDRYERHCARCHVAGEGGEAACGRCHVAVGDGAGGRLLSGHRFRRSSARDEACTACHGSRIRDEYEGANGALQQRNRTSPVVAAADPSGGAPLLPDVHRAAGMGCADCHAAGELHGEGAGAGRYAVSTAPACTDCHAPSTATSALHTGGHLAAMDCRVCHAQPYKHCFGCHAQETALGSPYHLVNETDPTRAARPPTAAPWSPLVTYAKGAAASTGETTYVSLQAGNLNRAPASTLGAWWRVGQPAGDALLAFRIGRNPRFGSGPDAPRYALLRHAPVDGATLEYTDEGTRVPGLLPALAAAPTWGYATPHNVVRSAAVTAAPPGGTACGNCHGAAHARFWLTDPVADALGWVPDPALPGNEAFAFERDANAPVVQPDPVPPVLP